MDKETREALEGSIQKWEAIVDGTGLDKGINNCPLCDKFFRKSVVDSNGRSRQVYCRGCPVYEKTGREGCMDTPYHDFTGLDPDRVDERTQAAVVEVEFLKSLRPSSLVPNTGA